MSGKDLKPRVIIVDREDNIIGYKYRSELTENDISRSTSIWIENGKGDILIARRAYRKRHEPGVWGPAAAGNLDEGETYEENILKEVQEELGIRLDPSSVTFITKTYEEAGLNFFLAFYYAEIPSDTEFVLQEEEVADVRWVSWQELVNWVNKNPEDFMIDFERIDLGTMREYKKKL